jgi:antitoxin component YwqK of YwqJK toxin-antitoxin module
VTKAIDVAPPEAPPRLACDAGTRLVAAPAPEPAWWCARPDGARHGAFVSRFPDGAIEITASYRDGLLDGAWTRRVPGGAIVEAGTYAAGNKHGRWNQTSTTGQPLGEYAMTNGTGVERVWLDTGERYSERAFKDGVLDGATTFWAPDGTQVISARYEHGQLDGAHSFGTRATVRIEETFARGVRRGKRSIWAMGLLVAEEQYDRKGRLDGPYTLWRTPRVPRVRGIYTAGKRDGTWVWTDRGGNKEKQGRYAAGKRTGTWREWANGKLASSGAYTGGKLTGELISYDGRGRELGRYTMTAGTGTVVTFFWNKKPSSKQQFVDGGAHGTYQELTPTGVVVVDGTYEDDRKHGTWRFTAPDGTPLLVQTWERGVLDGKLEKYVGGKLATMATYDHGKVSGPYAEYRDGAPAVTGEYLDDQKHGTWTTHAADGSVRTSASYVRGVVDGPWRQVVDGVVTEGTMAAGRRAGTWTTTDRGGGVSTVRYAAP